jgi:hypothetical protein
MTQSTQCQKQIDELLNLPQQTWLLGAGVSKNAGIPLMSPLTDRVEAILTGHHQSVFKNIRKSLPEYAHVEHILSQIGDLIAIADRAKSKSVYVEGESQTLDELYTLHSAIQDCIRDTMRWGYIPACDGNQERIGKIDAPIVSIEKHVGFVKALFQGRRAGLERRPPVAFFTINYDTLLEDALALCRVVVSDGFSGGAMAFWEPSTEFERPFSPDNHIQARIYKLHGSIDWVISLEDIVVRRREGAGYPPSSGARLLIYPQATKYKVTQRDPFATLFSAFRSALVASEPGLLTICGYSFGDDHINEEIERALKQRGNRLTVLIFVSQDPTQLDAASKGLPSTLTKWLGPESDSWHDRIIVAGSHGMYHGCLENLYPCDMNTPHTWWSFEGITEFLMHGPEVEL